MPLWTFVDPVTGLPLDRLPVTDVDALAQLTAILAQLNAGLDVADEAALEQLALIFGRLEGTLEIEGTVNLPPATITALQQITGTVTLDATSLAALEQTIVTATLDPTSLAALEQITASLTSADLTTLQQLRDPETQQVAWITMRREQAVTSLHFEMEDSFADGLDPTKFASTRLGPAPVVATTSGELVVAAGDANGRSLVRSRRDNPFRAGAVSQTQQGVRLGGGAITGLRLCIRKAGSPTVTIAAADFTRQPGYALDTNAHSYQITYLGNAANWYVDGRILHSVSNVHNTARTGTLNLPLSFEVESNASSTVARWGAYNDTDGYYFEADIAGTNGVIYSRGASMARYGGDGITLRPLQRAVTKRQSITTAAGATRLDATPLPGRTAFSVQLIRTAAPNNSYGVLGFTQTEAEGAAGGIELYPGDREAYDLGTGVEVWVRSLGGTGIWSLTEVAQ